MISRTRQKPENHYSKSILVIFIVLAETIRF